ncbi:MAG: dCTP deaminase [Elusimicrobiota bacterium]|nr:dCTP deaminase [Elusimicrobiota bacterium]
MSILTHDEILKEIKKGRIKIDPFDPARVGPASVDLRMDNKFRVFKKIHGLFAVKEDSDYEEVTEYIEVEDYFLLMPGESVLGITKETITLPEDISGWLEGRSTFARLGLTVHVTASFMHPGISNKQVLEINNVSSIPLELYPGTFICQFIFQRCEGRARYEGRFKEQTRP